LQQDENKFIHSLNGLVALLNFSGHSRFGGSCVYLSRLGMGVPVWVLTHAEDSENTGFSDFFFSSVS
jgi:hypothetical protein